MIFDRIIGPPWKKLGDESPFIPIPSYSIYTVYEPE
jgi:hypothetical protein